jgi:hypothetical protein
MVRCEMQTMATTMRDRPEIEYLDGRAYPKVSPKLSHGLVQIALANGVREYTTGERFEHPALPWLQFDVDAIFADLDPA